MDKMIIKRTFFLLALSYLILLTSCANQSTDKVKERPASELTVDLDKITEISEEKAPKTPCENVETDHFRQGKFAYSHWNITRTEAYQIEFSSRTDVEYKSTIKWLNDCEYELICIESSQGKNDPMIGTVFHSKINKVQDDTAYITTTVNSTKLDLILVKLE